MTAATTDLAKLAPAFRLQRLGETLLSPTPAPVNGVAIEALLDAFLVLFDECSYSELKREKIVADFVKDCTESVRPRTSCARLAGVSADSPWTPLLLRLC